MTREPLLLLCSACHQPSITHTSPQYMRPVCLCRCFATCCLSARLELNICCRLSVAAAAVIAAPEGHLDELRPLVSLLAWTPARVLTPPAARLVVFAWFWVAAEAPAYLVIPDLVCWHAHLAVVL